MKIPVLSKVKNKHLLIVLGVAVVTAIVLAGLAEAVHEHRVAAMQATKDAQVQAAKDKQTQAVIDGLKADNAKLAANVQASCNYLGSLVQAKATKGLITVPTASGCVNPKQ